MAATPDMRIMFLCSGGGGTFRFVWSAIERGYLSPATICAVVADRECPAVRAAADRGVDTQIADFAPHQQKASLDQAMSRHQPDLVISTVHRILTPEFVAGTRGRIVNLHYSLLPAFGGKIGMAPVSAAMDYGVRLIGATSHLVDESLDGGRPVVQIAFAIDESDRQLADVQDTVFRVGCLSLLGAVAVRLSLAPAGRSSQVAVHGRHCLVAGVDWSLQPVADDKALWDAVQSDG